MHVHDGALLWVHLPFFPNVEECENVAVICFDLDALPVVVWVELVHFVLELGIVL